MKYRRQMLKDVEPYAPGEQPQGGGVIKLNTNENPYPPSPKVEEAIRALGPEAIRKYPDPVAKELRTACAHRYEYPGPEWVIAGNGMDELLALALRTFCDPGDAVFSPTPTYTLYETLCELHGAKFRPLELDDEFQFTNAVFGARGTLMFVPRPNAPSGVCVPREEMSRLCDSFDGLVVVDEAYVDFADDSCIALPKKYENAIVMRTFSKSFSLAGMRLGIAVARPNVINEFLKTKDSYNLNAYTQAAGLAAIEDYTHMLKNVSAVRSTRQRLLMALNDLGFDCTRSQANFVLARWNGDPPAKGIFEALKERKIFVRYFDRPRLEKSLRITVGTDDEIDVLLEAVREIVGAAPEDSR